MSIIYRTSNLNRSSKLFKYIMLYQKLRIPENYTYHCNWHILYVYEKSIEIAKNLHISKSDLELVKLAAITHDIGNCVSRENHEELGCIWVRENFPLFGFTKDEIDVVCGIIMATKIPQMPTTLLQKIVADADLFYLGTNDFKAQGDLLYKELSFDSPKLNRKMWNKIQINFMNAHTYHTEYCIRKNEAKKQANLESLLHN